ncbi:MAG: ROK family protein [Pseudomonadota bacterium]|nr:ROK family protein [Pseudomonadota bacterium]
MNLLVIDIGGTNIRYLEILKGKKTKIKKEKILSKLNFNNLLNKIISHCLNPIDNLVISAAGPKTNNSIQMTNQKFKIDSQLIKKKFNLRNCILLNDLEAAGYFLHKISKNKKTIKKGKKTNSRQVLITPGTGLGLSFVIDNVNVIPSEIGNSKILISEIMTQNTEFSNLNFSKIEDFLSGPGLSKIYKSLYKSDISSNELISQGKNNNLKALKTIKVFLEILAKFLAEISLIYVPGNGIFISGSLMKALKIFIDKDEFINIFLKQVNKTHRRALELVEINFIEKEHLSIFGCIESFNLIQKDLD